jgi:predicted RNA-binding protein Jag
MAEETKSPPSANHLGSGTGTPTSGTGAPARYSGARVLAHPLVAESCSGIEADDEVAREVGAVVRTIFKMMGIRDRVRIEKSGTEYYANVRPTAFRGLQVGRRGTMLRSIQDMARLFVQRKYPDAPPITIDVGGYRHRREVFLCKKAEAVARIVTETQREMALDPMTDKEKALVEEHLRNVPGIRVYSVASGSRQNVIVAPAKGSAMPEA